MQPNVLEFPGDVTSPEGFLAAGVHAGLKREKKDLALIVSRVPAAAAGTFTTNRIQAAPVIVTREHIRDGVAQAIIANSANANACNGPQGLEDAREMARLTAELLGLETEKVLVASTGLIGVPLPMDKIRKGIQRVAKALNGSGGGDAAEAIMTTDTCTKERAVEVAVGEASVTLGAIAKGSGMISPSMATMFAFITTDARIDSAALKLALSQAVDRTFNMITVDGDTSTNDMVLILANGLAGNPEIVLGTREFDDFAAGLEQLCVYLAKAIVKDGEGATKLMEITVRGAPSLEDARRAARSIAGSNLVKTAVFGEDANWGRVMAALGYSGAEINPNLVDVFLGPVQVVREGRGQPFSEEEARQVLSEAEIRFLIDLHEGPYEATAWGCDLSYEYVRINGSYRT